MSRIHLVKISSKIYEDTYNEGFVSFTGCGLRNEPIGKSFDSIDSALKHLHDHYGLPVGKENYDIDDVLIQTSKMVADQSNQQNGGWFEPTDNEYEAWKKGKTKLYTEDFYIECLKLITGIYE